MNTDFLTLLRAVNAERADAWAQGQPSDPLFWAVELGGEVGEILNVVKKLRREELGWRGSRSTVAALAEELADGLICLDSLARHYDIDLAEVTAAKFNQTSRKVGLPHALVFRSEADEIALLEGKVLQLQFLLARYGDRVRMASCVDPSWQAEIDEALEGRCPKCGGTHLTGSCSGPPLPTAPHPHARKMMG